MLTPNRGAICASLQALGANRSRAPIHLWGAQRPMPDKAIYVAAASKLVELLNSQNPQLGPRIHSVWVKTSVDDEGEFVYSLMVAIPARYRSRVQLPDDIDGLPIEEAGWGKPWRPAAGSAVIEGAASKRA